MARSDLFRKVKLWLRMAQLDSEREERARASYNARIDRRALLEGGGLLLAWGALPACVTQLAALQGKKEDVRPLPGPAALTIVGAGLAGLTAAYELCKAGIKVQIFEGSERSGGRVRTEYKFNADNMFCERGGEFVDTGHEELLILAHDLGVPVEPLASKDPKLLDEVYFFGGRFRSEKELIKNFAPLAALLKKSSDALMVKGELAVPTYSEPISDAVKNLDRLSLAAYLETCRPSVEPWVLELVRVAYVGEYGLEAEEQSALNLLILIDPETKDGVRLYGESDEAFRIEGGSSRLVEALEKAIKAYGVEVQYGKTLIAIRGEASGLSLSFASTGSVGSSQTVKSPKIVLALPLPILRSIDGLKDLGLSPVKKRMIAELGVGTNSKLMLGFRDRHWQLGGASKAFPASTGSIFTDLDSQAFWDSSRAQAGSSGILTNFLGGRRGLEIGPGKLNAVLTDLEKMLPGIGVKFDGKKLLEHWPSSPWAGGSYVCPKPGQYTELIGAAEEPELNDRLHFIGEYCSVDYGGYMNGAVASAKALAQRLVNPQGDNEKEAS